MQSRCHRPAGGGQLKAIATGLSLGSNPFVLMLDADDCLTDDALDLHLSWHLNSRVPVAFTSGRVQVIDELGRQLSGCLDNIVWLDHADSIADLPRADAYRRPDAQFEPPSASFIRQTPLLTGSLLRCFPGVLSPELNRCFFRCRSTDSRPSVGTPYGGARSVCSLAVLTARLRPSTSPAPLP
jgi:hypothetical protein